MRLSTGSLGGKARGLAFAINLLSESKLDKKYNNIKLRVPKVAVIGTDDFDHFMEDNKLWKTAFSKEKTDKAIIKAFLRGKLSKKLTRT